MTLLITKRDGSQEPFNEAKFKRSLERTGARASEITAIFQKALNNSSLKTTRDLYRFAFNELKGIRGPLAARYNLKQALFALGPTGFSFEKYAAKIFEHLGFEVTLNQIVKGFCVEHEVDFVAIKNNRTLLVECKFHALQKLKSDLKVALYVNARLADIEKYWHQLEYHSLEEREAWIVTNTKFSSEAIRYALCARLKLLGWGYPEQKSLSDFIHELNLYPITTLTTLKKRQKKELIHHGIILCRDLAQNTALLHKIGITQEHCTAVLNEAEWLSQNNTM